MVVANMLCGTRGFDRLSSLGVVWFIVTMTTFLQRPVWHKTTSSRWKTGVVDAFEVCGSRDDGIETRRNKLSYCPTGNTCCKMKTTYSPKEQNSAHSIGKEMEGDDWGCIPSDMGAKNATCCTDENSDTGCPSGYECRRTKNSMNADSSDFCYLPQNESLSNLKHNVDPLLQYLPRYRLCRADENNRRLYGLPVISANKSRDNVLEDLPLLAYYSNLGPIDQNPRNNSLLSNVEMALIFVHGANRNGDDYFCSAKATIELQRRFQSKGAKRNQNDAVLVVAPNFFSTPISPNDNPESPASYLYWSEEEDRDGTWRYGADASGPIPNTISSFDAMDAILLHLQNSSFFPKLSKITVAGHSSGGQFVQRWSLLTSPDVWPAVGMRQGRLSDPISIHAVVANPSNYVYFTPLRYLRSSTDDKHDDYDNDDETFPSNWRLPSEETDPKYNNCSNYNQWEYGLEDGGSMEVRYRTIVFATHSKLEVVRQYLLHRSVSYLIGELDRCDDGLDQRCKSHGLETTCADELQGGNRYERNARYMASLGLWASNFVSASQKIQVSHRHHRVVVPNVGHDHAMMIQSHQGIRAIYYYDSCNASEVFHGIPEEIF